MCLYICNQNYVTTNITISKVIYVIFSIIINHYLISIDILFINDINKSLAELNLPQNEPYF